ncbi:MAG TPA: hypothetical protein VF074_16960, partial [Pyrinomonadaceae bacterium]
MKTVAARLSLIAYALILSGVVLAIGGCRASQSNVNLNTNISNTNSAPANSNSNVSTTPISTIAAREPETYKATIVFTAQTEGGDKAIGIPTISADVARNGEDRRVSFKLPDGSDLIYLDRAGKPYAIA